MLKNILLIAACLMVGGILFNLLTGGNRKERNAMALAASEVKHCDETNFDAELKKASANGPVLIDFYATWCGPCQRLGPNLEQVAKEYKGKVTVIKVDADLCPNLAARYGVRAYPTLIMVKPDGTKETKLGYQDLSGLRTWFDAVLPKK